MGMNAREFFHKYRDEHPDLVLINPGWRTETVLTVMMLRTPPARPYTDS